MDNCVFSLTNVTQPKEVCQCILDKLQVKYRMQDFVKYTQSEIEKESLTVSKECLKETGEEANLINQQRIEAANLYEEGKYGDAISKLLEIINMNEGNVMDYNNIGYFYILTKQYLKAIKFLKQGESLDDSELLIKGNLAHAYLLSGDVDIAKSIYAKYKMHNISNTKSWGEMVIEDFKIFEQKGLKSEFFDDILSLLK